MRDLLAVVGADRSGFGADGAEDGAILQAAGEDEEEEEEEEDEEDEEGDDTDASSDEEADADAARGEARAAAAGAGGRGVADAQEVPAPWRLEDRAECWRICAGVQACLFERLSI